jgi:hypothetical protein
MSCSIKYQLLDLYFHEGEEGELSELSEHAAHCAECRVYLASMKLTLRRLSELEDAEPADHLIDNILADVSVSRPKLSLKKTGVGVVPILQIAFGEILVLALAYFIKTQISFTVFWEVVEQYRIVQSIGTFGLSIVLVLIVGSFITLAMAPVLLMDAQKKFNS